MGKYNKVLRHVDMNRVKQIHEKNNIKKVISENVRKKSFEIISNKNDPSFSNWRFDLNEGMTTQAFSYATTLPAEGDTALGDITSAEYNLIAGATVEGSTLVLDSNNIPGTFGNAEATTGFIDISKFDTLKFNITKRTIGSGEELRLFYKTADQQYYYLIVNELFINQTLDLRFFDRSKPHSFQLRSFFAGSTTPRDYTTWNINSAIFQRRTPITVFVPIDSPEATSFIRVDPTVGNLSPQEREKKLKKMLSASDQYLQSKFGDAFPGTNASQDFETRQPMSYMDIQVGDERVTKVDGKTVTDTMRGIEDGMIDGQPIETPPSSTPSTPSSTNTTDTETKPTSTGVPTLFKGKSGAFMLGAIKASSPEKLANDFRGTTVDTQKLKSLASRGEQISKQIDSIGRAAPTLSNERRIIALNKELNQIRDAIKTTVDGGQVDVKPISKPPTTSDDKNEIEKNIKASLAQLEIDNEELKGEQLKRNIEIAANLGLDILTVVTLLSPIPGDEVAAIAAQATKAGVKTGAKTATQKASIDAFRTEITKPSTLAKAQDAISRAGSKFAKDVAIPIKVQGKTVNVNANKILRNKGFQTNSYDQQGEVLMEKRKLKSPKAFFNDKDIKPEFPPEPPPPLVKGLHPDLVSGEKTAQRFNKLDPISARSMPRTGIKAIDKKVKAARKKPK